MPSHRQDVTPKFVPMARWCAISGMGKSKSYEWLADGKLRGFKNGRQLLIDVASGLRSINALPRAVIRPRTTPRRRAAKPADTSQA
jgi:hypothetical protein